MSVGGTEFEILELMSIGGMGFEVLWLMSAAEEELRRLPVLEPVIGAGFEVL